VQFDSDAEPLDGPEKGVTLEEVLLTFSEELFNLRWPPSMRRLYAGIVDQVRPIAIYNSIRKAQEAMIQYFDDEYMWATIGKEQQGARPNGRMERQTANVQEKIFS
jgi:hypothetical protein